MQVDLQNLERIKSSFPLIFNHKSEIAARFYDRLFRDAPEVRAMFRADMTSQKEMLATVLTILAKASFEQHKVEEIVMRLARSHSVLGISAAQFRLGEAALSEAVADVVGHQLAPDVLVAWQVAIRRVIDTMIDPPEP